MAFHMQHDREEELPPNEAKVRAEVRVPALPAAVWRVLTRTGSGAAGRAAWDPLVRAVEGRFERDAAVRLTLETPAGRRLVHDARVEAAEEGRRLRWSGPFAPPRLMEGTFEVELERRGDRQTKVVQRVHLRGLRVRWFKPDGVTDLRLGLDAQHEALKARVEAVEQDDGA